jgi:hypothetical protein
LAIVTARFSASLEFDDVEMNIVASSWEINVILGAGFANLSDNDRFPLSSFDIKRKY